MSRVNLRKSIATTVAMQPLQLWQQFATTVAIKRYSCSDTFATTVAIVRYNCGDTTATAVATASLCFDFCVPQLRILRISALTIAPAPLNRTLRYF